MQDLKLISDKEMITSSLADISQKMEEMKKMLVDLYTQVMATEDQQREVAASHTSSPSRSCPIRRTAKHQLSPDQEGDQSEEVRQRVVKSMR